MSSLPRPRRALIIGGGPVGLITLRNFLERGNFDDVQLVERRSDIGGVWYLDQQPKDGKPCWPSPAYPRLMGNVLPRFLSVSGNPFPPPSTYPDQPFPDLDQTQAFLRKFAESLFAKQKIRLNTEVIRVEELAGRAGWKVVLKDWNAGGKESEEQWDAVVVATAFHDNLNWPETDGLEQLREKGIATHSRFYEGAEGYEGKRVAVIGNANSGNDIAAQLAPVVTPPLYRSIRRPNMHWFPLLPHPNIKDSAPVVKYSLVGDKATLHLEDGTEVTDIDHVFLGTGYQMLAKFVHILDEETGKLKSLCDPPTKPPRIPDLHRYILYAPNPTLAFQGVVASAIPFTLGDLSSTWLALAWTSTLAYPTEMSALLACEKARLDQVEAIRGSMENPTSLIVYHILGPEELPYAKSLWEDVVKVRPELGSVLQEWNDEMWGEKEGMFGLRAEVMKKEAERGNSWGG